MAELTPEEKIENVEKQLRIIELGAGSSIDCPYCGEVHTPESQPMCATLIKCIGAILQRKDIAQQAEMADRIAEKALTN